MTGRTHSGEPKVREVLPGIYLLPLPLPMRPSIVNVYLLHGGDEWALIDTGINSESSLAAFREALALVGCKPEQIRKIICTHHHPDHFGASKPQKEMTGAHLLMHRAEWERSFVFAPADRPDWVVQYFERIGIPMHYFQHVPSPHEFWKGMYQTAEPDRFIDDGDRIRVGDLEIEVVWTPGHAPGHCVLYLRQQKAMIVGDHLLPKITPHIGFFPRGVANPLGDFLESQRKIQRFDVDLVLPAHGGVFIDHRHRANQIIQHHHARMQEMFDLIRRRPMRPYDIARHAFGFDRESPVWIQFPATFETLAHLEYMRHEGRVERREGEREILYGGI